MVRASDTGAGCALRVVFLCFVPAGAVAFDVRPGVLVCLFSAVCVALEVVLFILGRHGASSTGKSKQSLRPTRYFPLQLAGLYMLQIGWLVMEHGVLATPEGNFGNHEGDGAKVEGMRLGGAKLKLRGKELFDLTGRIGHSAALVAAAAAKQFPAEPSAAGGGPDFQLDAPPEALRWSPKTISVILPCAEEREYALKTVKSVFENTPADVLQEIVVVDDGSEPPLSTTHLSPQVQSQYKVKVMRHNRTIGLIGAKKTGGDAASGDILVFFDCHVGPQSNWYKDFLDLIRENYRRMVVPQITALNVDTWKQIGRGGGLAKCYLTWDADFKWFDSDDMYIAVISGGLLGMSKRWWWETGGYDKEMMGWGGENLDQSLRVWLCGGEIVMAPNSQVAHMWRDGTAKTNARYKHVGDTSRNRARAVYGWYGDFSEKLLDYPSFKSRLSYSRGDFAWYGDLSNFQEVKNRLGGCRPFAWFLKRFRKVYEDGGILPSEIFMIREEQSGKCLHFQGRAGTSGTGKEGVDLQPCNDGDDRFFWHLGNLNLNTGDCCSGLRAWNTDQCFQGGQGGVKGITYICAVSGRDHTQDWVLQDDGMLRRANGNTCMGQGDDPGSLVMKSCSSFRKTGGGKWTKQSAQEPLETKLYKKALQDNPKIFQALEK